MRVAIAQMNTRAGDFEATYEAMLAYGRRAAALQADLLVYPSAALMGADPMALIDNPSYMGQAQATLERLAASLELDALVPFMMGTAGAIFPVYAYLSHGEVITAGMIDRLGPITVGNIELGCAFTFDDLEAFSSGALDADIVCFMPVAGFDASDEATALLPAVSDGCFCDEARKSESWLVVANGSGAYEDYVYTGGSFIMSPEAELAAAAPLFDETLISFDIDVDSDEPLASPLDPPAYDRSRMLWDAAALALRDQVMKRNLSGALVALDGGLATSAVAALASDALGPMRVSALICATDKTLEKSARELAQKLHIHEVDEISYFELRRSAAVLAPDSDSDTVAQGLINLRLGAMAHEGNLLLVSEADKTELSVGEMAPLGATMSFAPFGDVFRSDITKIARWRNTLSPVFEPSVLERIAAPQGLYLEQMGCSVEYAVSMLDAALLYYFERGAGYSELLPLGGGEQFVRALFERLHKTRASRRFAPAFPVLSSRSLDELAAPVTDLWVDDGTEVPKTQKAAPERGGAPAAVADVIKQLGAGPAPVGALPDAADLQKRISEVLGLLSDVSAGSTMQNSHDDTDGDSWLNNLFSDN